MLDYLKIGGVGPARTLSLDFAERFNVITGDNGLGKSFLLDLSWWVLTRTWAGSIVLPEPGVKAQIEYRIKGKTGPADPVLSVFRPEESAWPLDAKRPPMPGIVIYIRIDGGFSVWDPARNYWRKDPERPAAYNFDSDDVWYGQGPKDKPVSEGLERDWVSWQLGKSEQFEALDKVLEVLSPEGERIRAGKPRRILLGEGRDRPTLRIGSEEVPVAFASAGMRRVLALAYFLVWSWTEHRAAATLLGKKAENRFVIIFDEPETHLHPRWQRSILPSLAAAIDVLTDQKDSATQFVVATHSPLVVASLEPLFDPGRDDLILLERGKDGATINQDRWAPQGDVSNWLVSDTFGLEQARSRDAERAIEAAEAFMRGETGHLPPELATRESIHAALKKLLPAHDTFWPRWIVLTGLLPESAAEDSR